MIKRRFKLKITQTDTPGALNRMKEINWARLSKCAPFVRGTLSAVGPKGKDGKRKTFALVCRRAKGVRSTYIPSSALAEVRKMVDAYDDAKDILATIADFELRSLLWRINKDKKEKSNRPASKAKPK